MLKQIQSSRRGWRRFTARFSLAGAIVLAACAGTLLPACSEPAMEGNEAPDTDIPICIAPDVQTRVTDGAFEEGDAVGLTVIPWRDGKEQSLENVRWEDNVKFVRRDGAFAAVSTPYFVDAVTKNTFYAYYPYNQTGFRKNSSLLDVAVKSDQRGAGASASDCLVAVSREVVPGGNPVPLVFHHILSQITICLKAGAGITPDELEQASVTLKNFRTEAVYDVESGVVSDIARVDDIIPCGRLVRQDDMLTGLSAILIPQERKAGESVFYVVYNGVTMAYKPDSDFRFEPGRNHVFTATVGMTAQGVRMQAAARLADWQVYRPAAEDSMEN